MKKKITRIMTAMVLAVMMVFTAIPFASAATNNNALDETKKVSFTLNCSKPDTHLRCTKLQNSKQPKIRIRQAMIHLFLQYLMRF